MQFVTIGKPPDYLRLIAVRWPSDEAPPELPREKRRVLQAELRTRELSVTTRVDLWPGSDYAGLEQFFDQVVAHWQEWENSSVAWGNHTALQFNVTRGPRPAGGPDHLILSIGLHGGGMRRAHWKVEASIILSPEELETLAHDLHKLTD